MAEQQTMAQEGSSLWADAWIKLRKNYLAVFGLSVLVLLCIVSLLTPWIAPYGYEQQNLMLGATPPSAAIGWGPISLGAICLRALCMAEEYL